MIRTDRLTRPGNSTEFIALSSSSGLKSWFTAIGHLRGLCSEVHDASFFRIPLNNN